jgi:hypothetical protein
MGQLESLSPAPLSNASLTSSQMLMFCLKGLLQTGLRYGRASLTRTALVTCPETEGPEPPLPSHRNTWLSKRDRLRATLWFSQEQCKGQVTGWKQGQGGSLSKAMWKSTQASM